MGLEPVGWMCTTMPREGAQYGGKVRDRRGPRAEYEHGCKPLCQVFMSGTEIRMAAVFQNRQSGGEHAAHARDSRAALAQIQGRAEPFAVCERRHRT